jgi:hypothetical protein
MQLRNEKKKEIPEHVYEVCESRGTVKDPVGHYYINTFCEAPTHDFGYPRMTAPGYVPAK